MIRTYSELIRFKTFEERFEYLCLYGKVGQNTFGYDRYLNQILYKSDRWLDSRDIVIIRDKGCDLGIKDREIHNIIYVHHMNPITIEDIELERDEVFDPEYLICSSFNTHNGIHYCNKSMLPKIQTPRRKNDTCPWK